VDLQQENCDAAHFFYLFIEFIKIANFSSKSAKIMTFTHCAVFAQWNKATYF